MPVLANVLMSARDDRLSITGTEIGRSPTSLQSCEPFGMSTYLA
jgi:DNA polymerase III sliding clamp (beta) subunit (PCNA family)